MANLLKFVDATIQNGGASYNMVTGELNPKSGYMVAIADHGTIVSLGDGKPTQAQIQYLIADFIKKNAVLLAGGVGQNDKYIGTWINEDKLYIDVSERYRDMQVARYVAASSNEIAIYDCKNKTDILIKE